MQPLTLSLIQTATHWHDAAANRALFEDLLDQVPEHADVVVLPEMFSTGFTMSSAAVAETMSGTTVRWMRALAAEMGRVVCGSLVIEEDGGFYNRFLWVSPDGVDAAYDKRHRFRMAGEHEHYQAGQDRCVITCGEWRVCPMVCYDLRFPVFFRNRGDYDLLLCVANWPAARQLAWETLLRARAIENLSYVAAVNITGVDGNEVAYAGGSVTFGPDGETLASAGDRNGVTTVSLDKAALEDYRQNFPAWQDADRYELDLDGTL